MDLARQIMSGFTPKNSLAPPQASFAPVFTSSKISNAPVLVQMSRKPSRKPGCGRHNPTFIRLGSRMTAATWPGYWLKRFATLFRMLKLATSTYEGGLIDAPAGKVAAVGATGSAHGSAWGAML